MKALVLGPTPPPFHGVATFTRALLDSNALNGMELLHLDTSDRRDASNLGKWDVENLCLGIANLAELAERSIRNSAEIVYLPLSQSVPGFLRDALFILQSWALGRRVVIHLHGGYFRTLYETQGPAFKQIARLALSRVSAAVVLGEAFRGIFSGLIDAERIHVVENGVADAFAEFVPPARPRRRSRATLLYMSTLTRTKGITELLEAVALARAKRPVELRVAGNWQEPELRAETMALIERLDLEDCVTFYGNVTGAAKSAFLADGDIFCLPTRYLYEGQPLAILEAMSAGLPVLATDRGVIASTVLDGVCGKVIKQDSSSQLLADAIVEMLADPERLYSMGRAARERFLQHYTLHVCHASLMRAFRTIMG